MKTEALDLRLLVEVIWPRRHIILLSSLLFAGLAYGFSGIMPLHFVSDGLLIVDLPDRQQDATVALATDLDVLRSPSMQTNVVSALELGDRKDLAPRYRLPRIIRDKLRAIDAPLESSDDRRLAAVGYLQQHLSVSASPDSRVISIAFDAGTPELAASVVNELMRQYIIGDYQAQEALDARTNGWLTDQAEAAEKGADAAYHNVLAFQASDPFSSLQGGSVAALDLPAQWAQLAEAKQAVVQAQLDLDQAEADKGQSEASSSTTLMLRQQQTDVMQRLAAVSASVGNDNPQRIALADDLRAIQRQIATDNHDAVSDRAQRLAVAKAELASVEMGIARASDNVARASKDQIELQHLMQVAQSKRAIYDGLLDRLQNAKLAAAQMVTARIVSPAVPPLKAEPSRTPINVVLGLLAGAVLATAYILLRHLLNARVGSNLTLNELSGVPSVGALPVLGSGRNQITRIAIDRPSCGVAETLRAMRLAINAKSETRGGTVVLITSAECGEGKTSVAAALALRAADDGMRVLLIECDLHRPRLAKELGLASASGGLEAVLSGGPCEGSVLQTHPASGLHCLLAAGSFRNPIRLLESQRFDKLIADARGIYDLIVVDSPPVLRVADAVLLSRSVNQIVLVVREDRTSCKEVLQAIRRFPPDRQSLLTTLLIGERASRSGALGYYSGYENQGRSGRGQQAPTVPKGSSHAVTPPAQHLFPNRP